MVDGYAKMVIALPKPSGYDEWGGSSAWYAKQVPNESGYFVWYHKNCDWTDDAIVQPELVIAPVDYENCDAASS